MIIKSVFTDFSISLITGFVTFSYSFSCVFKQSICIVSLSASFFRNFFHHQAKGNLSLTIKVLNVSIGLFFSKMSAADSNSFPKCINKLFGFIVKKILAILISNRSKTA